MYRYSDYSAKIDGLIYVASLLPKSEETQKLICNLKSIRKNSDAMELIGYPKNRNHEPFTPFWDQFISSKEKQVFKNFGENLSFLNAKLDEILLTLHFQPSDLDIIHETIQSAAEVENPITFEQLKANLDKIMLVPSRRVTAEFSS